MAVAAATDALQRALIGSGQGVGLRGGTFATERGTTWTVTLTDAAFAEDVTVSGKVTWNPGSPALIGFPGDGSRVPAELSEQPHLRRRAAPEPPGSARLVTAVALAATSIWDDRQYLDMSLLTTEATKAA